MTVDLTFCEIWNPPPGHVDLVFGVDPCASGADEHTVSVSADILPPIADVAILHGSAHGVLVAATIPAPVAAVGMWYDNAVWRGITEKTCAEHQEASPLHADVCDVYSQAATIKTAICEPVAAAALLSGLVCAGWVDSERIKSSSCIIFAAAKRQNAGSVCAPFVQLTPLPKSQCDQWEQAKGVQAQAVCMPWISLLKTARPVTCEHWLSATHESSTLCAPQKQGIPLPLSVCLPWDEGDFVGGWGGPLPPEPPQPPEPPCYNPEPGFAPLVFAELSVTQANLLFRCPGDVVTPPGDQIIVPIRRIYYMSNTATLIRVSDGAEIPAIKLTAAIDSRSWVWSLSADIPIGAQSIVESAGNGPVELEAAVNGHVWRFYAENLRRNRAFGNKSFTVSGRGLAASLDAPFSQEQSFSNTVDRTAIQLMEDALTINGQPIGWTIDGSEITDWLVTSGAWSHYGTHISAINQIAASIDALVQADPTGQTIRIRPRYPVLPWKWSTDVTADIVLPEDVVVQEGLEWQDKPNYNGVYVSGQNQGVLGQVKITGTAGDVQAPMVTDPLITHANAARQRGETILGNTGRQQRLTLSMPIGGDTTLPVITPGTFLAYGPQSTIGLVRGVRVDANRPQFRQSVDIEVHL